MKLENVNMGISDKYLTYGEIYKRMILDNMRITKYKGLDGIHFDYVFVSKGEKSLKALQKTRKTITYLTNDDGEKTELFIEANASVFRSFSKDIMELVLSDINYIKENRPKNTFINRLVIERIIDKNINAIREAKLKDLNIDSQMIEIIRDSGDKNRALIELKKAFTMIDDLYSNMEIKEYTFTDDELKFVLVIDPTKRKIKIKRYSNNNNIDLSYENGLMKYRTTRDGAVNMSVNSMVERLKLLMKAIETVE